jgi:hypothetical protein|tara:strand:+ start:3227 stop:3394 length:168 start_codon:yes stop_codon:yes gene_type:complete
VWQAQFGSVTYLGRIESSAPTSEIDEINSSGIGWGFGAARGIPLWGRSTGWFWTL